MARLAALALAGALAAAAQTAEWRPIGSSSAERQLAGPATGPMLHVWYSDDGSVLYARTATGKVFKTQDFEAWEPAPDAPAPPALQATNPVRPPALDPTARVVALSASSQEVWGLGKNLYRSVDNGKGWATLTALRSESIVGDGMHGVAVSPKDPQQVVVANDYGVWRTIDGGLTWAGLNRSLPNLAVQRILATPSGAHGARIQTESLEVLELPPGAAVWQHLPSLLPTEEANLRKVFTDKLGTAGQVTAFAQAGNLVYAGTNRGQIFESVDGGVNFQLTGDTGAGAGQTVERIFVDPAQPKIALAALSGDGRRVLRTISDGQSWDDLTADLPQGATAHAVTGDRAADAVYVATDAGVFYAHDSLQYAVAVGQLDQGIGWAAAGHGRGCAPRSTGLSVVRRGRGLRRVRGLRTAPRRNPEVGQCRGLQHRAGGARFAAERGGPED